MNDNVKKIFEILGVEPNEVFKIKSGTGECFSHKYFLDENLKLKIIDNDSGEWFFARNDTFMDLIKGTLKIIKLPKKKKLRDITPEEWDNWRNTYCLKELTRCDGCLFRNVRCYSSGTSSAWVHNKDLYSDKFLDQEIEVE